MAISLIYKYFPQLKPDEFQRLEVLVKQVEDWNNKINLISRKDTENIWMHHILHSLSIGRHVSFGVGSRVMDLGTGGGFPGLPLACMFPEVQFVLLDSIGKKVKVVEDLIDTLGLCNAQAYHMRAEDWNEGAFDFVVSRAVASLDQLWKWCGNKIHLSHKSALPNGLIALKGGSTVFQEKRAMPKGIYAEVFPLKNYFDEPWFEEKYIVYVQK